MVKARKAGVSTPCLYLIDSSNSKIYMERIDGVTAKQFILDCMESKSPPPFATPAALRIAREIGKMVAKMHDAQV
ncbi:unnamed protein product [Sphacelaria rigidula]